MFLGDQWLWRLMLSCALSCFATINNNNIFSTEKGKKEEKKDMQVESNGAVSGEG